MLTDEETLQILDAWLLAHRDYDTMPPRPAGGFFGAEMGRWEQRRLAIETRIYETGQEFRAMCAKRAAQLARE